MKKQLKSMFALSGIMLALVACSSNYEMANVDAPYPKAEVGVTVGEVAISPFLQGLHKSYEQLGKDTSNVTVTLNKVDDANTDTQIAQLDEFKNKGVKAFIINLASTPAGQSIIDRYCDSHILIFVNRNPGAKAIASCENAYVVAGDYAQSGILQGLQIVEYWKKHPEWDRNKDGRMQVALLKGLPNHAGAAARAKWATATMESYPSLGVDIDVVFEDFADFKRDVAKDVMGKWLKNPAFNQVEVVLANSDAMALGVIEVFKEHNMKLPLFGIDGSDEANASVKAGDMTATIFHDHITLAKVSTRLAANLLNEKKPTDNIPYQMRNRVILVPYQDTSSEASQ